MKDQDHFDQARRGSRFNFLSKVKYVVHADDGEKEHEGLAFDVSIDGICLVVDTPLEVGEEIVITECILPYCRERYTVRWAGAGESATYRVGLSRSDKAEH